MIWLAPMVHPQRAFHWELRLLKARIAVEPDANRRAELLCDAAIYHSVIGRAEESQDDRDEAPLFARQASEIASETETRLRAARAWVRFEEQAHGPAAGQRAFESVFQEYPEARGDSALRARYMATLLKTGNERQVLRIFADEFMGSAARMGSVHSEDAVRAAAQAARRLHGEAASRALLGDVIKRWPKSRGASTARELL
ncbi:MAG: hypothetical protein ABFE08_12265 [Armatimonadia bacterium]